MCHTSYIDAPKKLIKVAENTWFEDKVGQNKKPSRNEHRDENCSAGPSTKSFFPFRFVSVCFRFFFYHNFARISRFMNEKHCPTSETREGPKTFGFRSSGEKIVSKFSPSFFFTAWKASSHCCNAFFDDPLFVFFNGRSFFFCFSNTFEDVWIENSRWSRVQQNRCGLFLHPLLVKDEALFWRGKYFFLAAPNWFGF